MKYYSSPSLIPQRPQPQKVMETFRSLRIFFVLLFTFLFCIPTTYSQNDAGDIHGKLTDYSINKPVANHTVTLSINKAENVSQQETKTDDNGNYRFENLPLDDETHYTVSTSYNGFQYTEKDIVLTSWVPSLSVNIRLNDMTDDVSQVRIKSYTIALGLPPQDHAADGGVAVIEALDVENLSKSSFQTKLGSEKVGLKLRLPEGYEEFHPHSPRSLSPSATGKLIILKEPLSSGETKIGYTYIHHALKDKLNLSRTLQYPADKVSFLVPVNINLEPRSKHFKTTQYEVINNVVYKVYPASPAKGFPAGKKINLKLGLPKEKFTFGQTVLIAIASVLAGGFFVAAIFMIRGAHRASAESNTSDVGPTDEGWLRKLSNVDLEHARTSRLEFITQLDVLHEKQEISERVYNRLRKEQTARLTEILDHCKERGIDS